jgi:hypothetical protein
MARNTAVEEDVDVEAVEPDTDEVEETAGSEEKAAKGPKRGDLPEGFVTPVGFAKIVGERGLHTNRDGEVVTDVKPQMIYSYIRNSPKDDPFPVQEVEDSNGVKRQVLDIEEGVAWWERKNDRASQRKQNAADKAAKKEARQSKQADVETGEADPSVLDAEEAE